MPADVTFQRDEYQNALPLWAQIDDAMAGEHAVKAQGDAYLPRPNPTDQSPENRARYDQYLARAVYTNFVGRTHNGLLGVAFRQWPEIELPAAMDYIKEDATGSGVTLIQQAQQAVSKAIGPGRYGLLVDYPPMEAPASKAAMVSGGAQATIALYPPKSITNWRTAKVGGKTILSLVVLAETHEQDDGFGLVSEPQFRVLRLKESVYTVEIWRQGEKDWVIAETYIPKRGNGQPWREIPFTFGGAQDNEPSIGPMPMLDLATLNLAHYRNSADYEDSAYFIGQPQPWMSGLDEQWRDHMEKSGIYLGSRAPWLLPVNGQAGIMQAAPNTLAKAAMDQKEQQMAQLGARMVMPGSAIKTATQQDSEDATAHSVLSLACDNVSAAFTQALTWACDFMSATGTASLSIPTEFVTDTLDAQMLTALHSTVQAGDMPRSDFWAKLREVGLIDAEKTDDEIREELASEPVGDLTDALGGSDALGGPDLADA